MRSYILTKIVDFFFKINTHLDNNDYIYSDFPRPDLGLNIRPFPIKKWAETYKNGVYHFKFLVLRFGENSWKSEQK